MLTLIEKAQQNIEAYFDTLETNLFLRKDLKLLAEIYCYVYDHYLR